ncbi:MAG: UDP-N-acetylmuramate--L-alanine ligase [Chloroflexi bacterium]|nr:UDP-N-acetylmuramate--L-alanine ligase [Chloroflexota bacterium]
MLENKRHIHLIGIGGSGMSPLAKVLAGAGYRVSGSDLAVSRVTDDLAELGVQIRQGHHAEHVGGADLVVISSAIPADNPELQQAKALGLPIVKRAELLGELTRRQHSILIAGTHGKTTTSSMVSLLLERAGLDPTVIVGGEIIDLGTSAKLGKGAYLVAEADEFDGTFLRLSPWVAVINNIEADHLDYYADLNAITGAFGQFMARVPEDGHVVACWDDPRVRKLARQGVNDIISFGLSSRALWRATRVHPNKRGGNDFDVVSGGSRFGAFSLQVPGKHNVANALASVVVAALVGIGAQEAAAILSEFRGAARRFEFKGAAEGVVVYDDYAHHPTEIAATLKGARERHPGRIWAIFQPHTYNRTKNLLGDFARALELADRVIVTDVYMPAGREVDTLGVSARNIVEMMHHPGAEYLPTLDEATARVLREVRGGDMVLTMGAGNVNRVAQAVLEGIRQKV